MEQDEEDHDKEIKRAYGDDVHRQGNGENAAQCLGVYLRSAEFAG